MKKLVAFFLASFLFCGSVSAERYVALGDSLAAGQTPYTEIDAGYTDFIALQLAGHEKLTSFSKQLAFPGYTVADVLARVKQDGQQLEQATLITISAGANDLLPLVSYRPATGTVQYSQLAVNFSLNRARENYVELLKEIKQHAPKAKVYVMGYYFPYVSLHTSQRAGVEQQLDLLNQILEKVATEAGAVFVPVSFSAKNRYLPNIGDVHPNQLGYMEMANAFLKVYGLPALTSMQLPAPNPLTFEEIAEQQRRLESPEPEGVALKPIEDYAVYYGYALFERFFL